MSKVRAEAEAEGEGESLAAYLLSGELDPRSLRSPPEPQIRSRILNRLSHPDAPGGLY